MHAAPAVSCAIVRIENAHEIQVQSEHSGIPCAMALRLMPCSPRRRIRLVTVADGLAADRKPGRVRTTSASLTPATGARTTRFCRTHQRRSSCASFDRSRTSRPAITLASDAVASTASCPNVRDDRDTPLLWDRVRRCSHRSGSTESGIFWREGTGRPKSR